MKALYDVFLVYAEDRVHPAIMSYSNVIADSEEDAKIKSGAYSAVQSKWDADFLTIIVRKIGDVKVKARPSEVKQV